MAPGSRHSVSRTSRDTPQCSRQTAIRGGANRCCHDWLRPSGTGDASDTTTAGGSVTPSRSSESAWRRAGVAGPRGVVTLGQGRLTSRPPPGRRWKRRTPGQLAGVLLHQSLAEVLRRLPSVTPSVDSNAASAGGMTNADLEETLESVLAAAAKAKVHLRNLGLWPWSCCAK